MIHTLATLYSAELDGLTAQLIEVEIDLNVGLHSFNIVGLADKAVSEAKERVNSALKNAHTKPPNKENRKITVNLAPADIKKSGSHYDLAIAIGYLCATKQIKTFNTQDKLFVGELSLDGRIRPIHGVLSIARLAKKLGNYELYLPLENAREGALIEGISIIPVTTLQSLIDHLEERILIKSIPHTTPEINTSLDFPVDISEIKGQEHAKRALTIAAAGGHNLLRL